MTEPRLDAWDGLIAEPDGESATASLLSSRELVVLKLAAKGYTERRIASRLVITLASARQHLDAIERKLGVNNRAEAVSMALKTRLIEI